MSEDTEASYVYGSSFLRHYDFDYQKLSSLPEKHVHTEYGLSTPFFSFKDNSSFQTICNRQFCVPDLPQELAPLRDAVENYEDVVNYNRGAGDSHFRLLYCSHIVNHSLKARALVAKNNEKAIKLDHPDDSLRDQGFHRARCLVLLPTKNAARLVVNGILKCMPKGSVVSHRKRFEEEYGGTDPADGDRNYNERKPVDYQQWFDGNTNDNFRLGLSFAKKSVKLYSSFADSDIVLASPLGIKSILDDESEGKALDIQNITASIEVLVIDQAEQLLMQNWHNVQLIVDQLNVRPTKSSFPNPARIRLAHLAGQGHRYRQSLLFSAVPHPLFEFAVSKFDNFQGINYFPYIPKYPGPHNTCLGPEYRLPCLKGRKIDGEKLRPPVNLQLITFSVQKGQQHSVEEEAPLSEVDFSFLAGRAMPLARLAAFKQRILPRLTRGLDKRVLIYVPDFYDYEEVRRLLQMESMDFCHINEYTKDDEADRLRNLFDEGRIRIMLLSERYYFFKRRKMRGASTFIFVGPPTFPWFVHELLEQGFRGYTSRRTRRGESEPVAPPRNKKSKLADVLTERPDEPTPTQYNVTILYFPMVESRQVCAILGKTDL